MRRSLRLTTVDLHRLDKFFSSCINKTLSARKDIQLSKIHGSEESDRCLHFSVKKKRVTKTFLGGHRFVSCLERTKRSNHGGAGRDRTDDLRLAKPALSQLSYSPTLRREQVPTSTNGIGDLSIRTRDEDATCIVGTRPTRWWAWVDSNYRPPAYQADALTD